MIAQVLIGGFMIVLTATTAGGGFFFVERLLMRHSSWLATPPFIGKRLLYLCASLTWFLLAIFLAVTLWSWLYLAAGVFTEFEEALYFSIVAYTTLGFGDILLPDEWRLLSGIEALNGLLMIGLQTAMLIEIMTRIRRHQMSGEL